VLAGVQLSQLDQGARSGWSRTRPLIPRERNPRTDGRGVPFAEVAGQPVRRGNPATPGRNPLNVACGKLARRLKPRGKGHGHTPQHAAVLAADVARYSPLTGLNQSLRKLSRELDGPAWRPALAVW
jgi:hypothetical protein